MQGYTATVLRSGSYCRHLIHGSRHCRPVAGLARLRPERCRGKTVHRTVFLLAAFKSRSLFIKKNRHRLMAMPVFWCRWRDLPGLRAGAVAGSDCHRQSFTTGPSSPASSKSKKYRHRQKAMPVFLVPVAGLEPARYCYQWILSPPRLPIPTHRRPGITFSANLVYYNTTAQK